MRSLFVTLVCLLAGATVFGQSNPLDKQLQKAYTYIDQNKLSEADDYVAALVQKNPSYGEGWDLLTKIRYALYENSKQTDGLFRNVTVSTTDKKGKTKKVENDSLAEQLMTMLNKIKPLETAYSKYVYTMRQATAQSREAWESSYTLRATFIDVNIDSNVGKKALNYFRQAEEEFAQKNFNKAALLYKRALDEQPDFYKASMYLGDCYYMTENYLEAVTAFKAAKDKFPSALEPRKYLTDAYAKLNMYDKAADEAMRSLTVYPDYSNMQKLEDALYLNHQKLNIGWTPRGVLPNKYTDTSIEDINEYNPEPVAAAGPWASYRKAYDKALPYCNKNGMLRQNSLTTSPYLEVYSWEEMLKNSKDPALDEARRMQQLNYLDCYVLVTCFHYDLYPQYLDFVSRNRQKVLDYYKSFIKFQ